jgi:hypothetical protein
VSNSGQFRLAPSGGCSHPARYCRLVLSCCRLHSGSPSFLSDFLSPPFYVPLLTWVHIVTPRSSPIFCPESWQICYCLLWWVRKRGDTALPHPARTTPGVRCPCAAWASRSRRSGRARTGWPPGGLQPPARSPRARLWALRIRAAAGLQRPEKGYLFTPHLQRHAPTDKLLRC